MTRTVWCDIFTEPKVQKKVDVSKNIHKSHRHQTRSTICGIIFFFDTSTACFMSLHIPWVVKKFGICPTNQLNQLRPTSQGPQPGARLRLLVHVADNGADLAQDIGPTKPCGQNDNGAPRKKGKDDFFVVAGGCNPFFFAMSS